MPDDSLNAIRRALDAGLQDTDIDNVVPIIVLSAYFKKGNWPGPYKLLRDRSLGLTWVILQPDQVMTYVNHERARTWEQQHIDWQRRAGDNLQRFSAERLWTHEKRDDTGRLLWAAMKPGKHHADFWHLASMLFHLIGDDQKEYERLELLADNDEAAWREAFVRYIYPHFLEMPVSAKLKLKDSFRYFLAVEPSEFYHLMCDLQDIPMSNGTAQVKLAWLWDVLWPGESYQIDPSEQFEVNNDIKGAREVCPPVGGWPADDHLLGGCIDSTKPGG